MYFFEGVEAVLIGLNKRGHKLGIVTSRSKKEYELYFQPLQLARYFPILLCADDTKKHKPDPKPLYAYMKRANVDSASCL